MISVDNAAMSAGVKRPGSVTLLVGIILLISIAGFFATRARVLPCPSLHQKVFGEECRQCEGRGRVTIWNNWFWQPEPVAVLLILDASGNRSKQDLAVLEQSCVLAHRLIFETDRLGILAFGENPRRVVELGCKDTSEGFDKKILSMAVGGKPQLFPALVEGLRMFKADPRLAKVDRKHVILISDGDTPSGDYQSVIQSFQGEGINVSTICISSESFDPTLMAQIADWGRGRFNFTNRVGNLPEFICQEVRRVLIFPTGEKKMSISQTQP